MPTSSDDPRPGPERPPSKELREQQKTAHENVTEGYGSTVKSRIISGQPDGDTQGGPGSNNDNHNKAPS